MSDRDEVRVEGVPPVHAVIEGGIHGDTATAGVVNNLLIRCYRRSGIRTVTKCRWGRELLDSAIGYLYYRQRGRCVVGLWSVMGVRPPYERCRRFGPGLERSARRLWRSRRSGGVPAIYSNTSLMTRLKLQPGAARTCDE